MPIAWFRFTGITPDRALADVLPDGDALLVDIDPTSDERGSLHAIVAQTLAPDDFTATGLVALAPRPGTVLRANTRYAFVLRRSFAPGVEPPPAFAELVAGGTPDGARGGAAAQLYAPLWATLGDSASIAMTSWSRPCSPPATRSAACTTAARASAPPTTRCSAASRSIRSTAPGTTASASWSQRDVSAVPDRHAAVYDGQFSSTRMAYRSRRRSSPCRSSS
jgi:hypothetical protein